LQAGAEREALRHQLAIAETDPLTGTRTRAPGLRSLDPCEVKVGFAALTPEDSAADRIERADADLPNRRAQ
jgi:hypothetical protein